MKTLKQLYSEHEYHDNESKRILNEIFHHPDFIKTWFEKLNLNTNHTYLNKLIERIDVVYSGYTSFTYSIQGKHYYVDLYEYDNYFHDIEFYFDGKKEGDVNKRNYKKYKPNQYERLLKILKIYFANKCSPDILNELLEKEKLEDFVVIGFLLFLNRFKKSK